MDMPAPRTMTHLSQVIRSWVLTRTLREFEHAAGISHNYAVYLRDGGGAENKRMATLIETLEIHGHDALAADLLRAHVLDHIPPGFEREIVVRLADPTTAAPPRGTAIDRILRWLSRELPRNPELLQIFIGVYFIATGDHLSDPPTEQKPPSKKRARQTIR